MKGQHENVIADELDMYRQAFLENMLPQLTETGRTFLGFSSANRFGFMVDLINKIDEDTKTPLVNGIIMGKRCSRCEAEGPDKACTHMSTQYVAHKDPRNANLVRKIYIAMDQQYQMLAELDNMSAGNGLMRAFKSEWITKSFKTPAECMHPISMLFLSIDPASHGLKDEHAVVLMGYSLEAPHFQVTNNHTLLPKIVTTLGSFLIRYAVGGGGGGSGVEGGAVRSNFSCGPSVLVTHSGTSWM